MYRNVSFFMLRLKFLIPYNFQVIRHCIVNLWKFCVFNNLLMASRKISNGRLITIQALTGMRAERCGLVSYRNSASFV